MCRCVVVCREEVLAVVGRLSSSLLGDQLWRRGDPQRRSYLGFELAVWRRLADYRWAWAVGDGVRVVASGVAETDGLARAAASLAAEEYFASGVR